MSDQTVVIVGAKRTPIGSFQGQFNDASAIDLGAAAIAGAIDHAGIDAADINEVIMGCVLPAGLGQAPARQAALKAGVPVSVGCLTVNKVCGSGMKAVMLGHDAIRAGSSAVVVAGGMESMTNSPYLLPKARGGLRMGHGQVQDHMFWDGLQSPYDQQMMGVFGEMCAEKYNFSRIEQDGFATHSVERAQRAVHEGHFVDEIVPVTVKTRKGEHTVSVDEVPGTVSVDKIPNLRPAFAKDGTVTAASSSSISDGASALVIMRASEAEKRGLEPLARIVGHSAFAHEPAWCTTAPVDALKLLQQQLGWTPDDVDLYEINEAFACVTMAAMTDVGIDHAKVNVNGGACALGHPIGATGARITTTLLHAMRARNLKRGIATQCIGGGEATAVALEID